jgi:hypothetical protein
VTTKFTFFAEGDRIEVRIVDITTAHSGGPAMRILGVMLLITLEVVAPRILYSQNYRSALILSPYAISMSDVPVDQTSGAQTVTLVNTGLQPVHITGIQITGNFSQTNDCPSPNTGLSYNDSCMIQVTFKPNTVGAASGTLTVTDDIPGGTLTADLSGSGTLGVPAVAMSGTSLSFPEQSQGVVSSPQTVTVSNSGKKDLFISGLEVNGDFTITPGSTCENLPGPLAPGANCTILVTFSPLEAGRRDGQLTITDNAEGSPQKLSLSGIGKQ